MTEVKCKTNENNNLKKQGFYNQIKSGKIFKRLDVLVFLIALMIIGGIFLGFYLINNKKPQCTGVEFVYNDEVVFTFNFDGTYQDNGFTGTVKIDKRTDNVYLLDFYFNQSQTEYTIVKINLEESYADVLYATCSYTQDCSKSPAIRNGEGAIICVPYNFKILPINGNRPLVTG